eukprot:TRINITY_DN25267_c0_g6_i1.p1 TRINITY_DN25267_c0_g6~~TRINITY_DN25267_c0_g6_i1.p1  ORF type:complete len:198 (-),score=25.34 TRINITY_DN25267_c0_g6_i1:269-862(-)
MSQESPQQSTIGLSDVAEQRWRQLTGGKHLLEGVYMQAPPKHHDTDFYAQRLGFASRGGDQKQNQDDDFVPAFEPQSATTASGGRDSRPREGVRVALAYPTQQFIQEMSQNPNAPLLPSTMRDAPPFVPPEGEEWHIIEGFYVRMSRAELDQLLARADASDSEDEDIDSLADTSVGGGSVCDDDVGERDDDYEVLHL